MVQKFKDSNEYKGKPVRVCYKGNDSDISLECVIDIIEEGGILIHYWSDPESNDTVEEDYDDAVYTQTYIPWTAVHYIDHRSDEKYDF